MEENVALDSSKQKKFVKSIKGIKKLIKNKDAATKAGGDTGKVKKGRVHKKRRKARGLVYLSHIPHGFYEHEMTQYFKQFGVVTNARVIKSKRTGRSKGYAFVEFKEPAVADIVAETMNNYLMGKRLIKAAVIPPEKQRKAFRKNWSIHNNPGLTARIKNRKSYNENRDEKGEFMRAKKRLLTVKKTMKKLSEVGISYIFTPVDVPEGLLGYLDNNKVTEDSQDNITTNNTKSKKKVKKESTEEIKPVLKVKGKAVKTENNEEENNTKKSKVKSKKIEQEVVVNKKEQKQKKHTLKEKGVKSMKEFIKIEEDSDESGSDFEFDSDEYEKVLDADEDSVESEEEESTDDDEKSANDSEEEESNDDELSAADSDESEEVEPPKPQRKNKVTPKTNAVNAQIKKAAGKQPSKVEPQHGKRKAPQKTVPAPTVPKKPKFEKQTNQKQRNKQFKKKK